MLCAGGAWSGPDHVGSDRRAASVPTTTVAHGAAAPASTVSVRHVSRANVRAAHTSAPDGALIRAIVAARTKHRRAARPLDGWALTSTNIGLTPFGLSCGNLPRYTGPMAPPAGTIISKKLIVGELDASAGGITIDKSCFKPSGTIGLKGILNTQVCDATDCWTPHAGTVVTDSEFDGDSLSAAAAAGTCAMVGLATLVRNYIHGMGSGICYFGTGGAGSAAAINNYVTGLRSFGDSHNEAGTVRDFVKDAGNTRTLRWIGNRLFCDGNVTAALFLQPTWSSIDNVWVTGNYLEGGGYNLYSSGGQTGARIGNAHATNNRFRSTGWGPAVVDGVDGWAEWSDNYLYNPAAPAARGAVVPDPS
jgi:hypothetical protein